MTKKERTAQLQFAKFELTKYAHDHAAASYPSAEYYATRKELQRAALSVTSHEQALARVDAMKRRAQLNG